MTGYRGTTLLHMSGVVENEGTFVGDFTGTLTPTLLVLSGAETVTGSMRLAGSITVTIFYYSGGSESDTVDFVPATYPVSTSLSNFNFPIGTSFEPYGLKFTQSASFNTPRSAISVTGAGTFDAFLGGFHILGDATLSGALNASTAAYSIAAANADRTEGQSGTTAFTYTVTRIGDTAAATSVSWSVAGSGTNPAGAADFAGGKLPQGVLQFAAAETTKTLTLDVAGDAGFEPDEQFTVAVVNAPGEFMVTAPDAIGRIANDDAQSTIAIAATAADLAEGNADSTAFSFALSRSGDTSGLAGVGYSVTGTGLLPATADDFVGAVFPAGTVEFAGGETTRTLVLDIAGDTSVEGHEGFLVTLDQLSAGTAVTIATATGTIRADDAIVDLAVADGSTGLPRASAPTFYDGPVAGLEKELILITPDNLVIAAAGNNWFIHTGSGTDAIAVAGGTNVLDGGTGSNFLTGAGAGDTFFVDVRGATAPIWSTLVAFGKGDAATLWGITEAGFTLTWLDAQGAAGFTGLTLHATAPGAPTTSLTLAGFGKADLDSGRLSVQFGTEPLSGSVYTYIYANS